MAIKLAQAKLWCTSGELALVKSSRPPMIGELSAAQLKQAIKRTQRLVDKWVKLSREQHRRLQADRGYRRGGANERSGDKAALFSEVLEAFKAKLAAKAAKPKPVAKPAGKSTVKPVAARPAAKPAGGKRSVPSLSAVLNASSVPGIQLNVARQIKASAAGKAFRFNIGGMKRTQRHGRAMNQRNQAKRDARGRS